MELLKTVKIREQKQVTVAKKELLAALGFDPAVFNIHGAFVSSLDEGNVTFGISSKSVEAPFEMGINDD